MGTGALPTKLQDYQVSKFQGLLVFNRKEKKILE